MAAQLPDPALFHVHAELQVRWGDLDALGHVNNSNYFTFFETARFAYIDRVSPGRALVEGGMGPILASTGCDFVRPVEFPATLVLSTRVVKVGSSSFEAEHLVRDRATGEIHAVGRAVLVMYDYRSRQKVPIPSWLRDGIREIDGI